VERKIVCFTTTYRNNEILNEFFGKSELSGNALRKIFEEYSEKLEEIDLSKYKQGDFQKKIYINAEIKDKYISYFGTAKAASKAFAILMHELTIEKMK